MAVITREHVRAALESLVSELRGLVAEEMDGAGYTTEEMDVEAEAAVILLPIDQQGDGVQCTLVFSALPVRLATTEDA